MSTLSSASSLAQIKAAYADNASYAEDASASKAAAFITACRLLLLKLPSRAKQGAGFEVELDLTLIRSEMTEAKRWLDIHGTSSAAGGVRHADFATFRD